MPFVSFSIDGTTERLLAGLMLLWCLLLFGGFVYGLRRANHEIGFTASPRIPRKLRLGSSLCLAVAAWIWLQAVQANQPYSYLEDFALWFALGASLSCLGDFIQLLVNAAHAQQVSLLTFMTAHIAYISGMIGVISSQINGVNSGIEGDFPPLVTMVAATWVWIMIGMIAWYFWVYRRGDEESVNATPLVYAILLSVTAGMATALTLENSNFFLLAVGAALLWFSELIVAPQFIRDQESARRAPLIGDLVWLTYGPGQLLLVLGVAIAMLTFVRPFIYYFY